MPRQKYVAQVKEQIKAPEKIQLSIEEIPKLSEAQFKTLVIRRLTEMAEYGHKIEEKVKAIRSEIKENGQGTNSEGKETGTRINGLDQKEEISIQPEQNEETRIQKNEERLRNLRNNCKCSNIRIVGVPEGEEEDQEIENLFEEIEGELPQSGKGNRLPGSPGSSESQRSWTQGGTHQGTSSLHYPN